MNYTTNTAEIERFGALLKRAQQTARVLIMFRDRNRPPLPGVVMGYGEHSQVSPQRGWEYAASISIADHPDTAPYTERTIDLLDVDQIVSLTSNPAEDAEVIRLVT